MGRTCAFGTKIVVFEYAAFQLTPYQIRNKKNLKIPVFAFCIPARLADFSCFFLSLPGLPPALSGRW